MEVMLPTFGSGSGQDEELQKEIRCILRGTTGVPTILELLTGGRSISPCYKDILDIFLLNGAVPLLFNNLGLL